MNIPFFLTVDTEGDNIWDRPKTIKSKNVENLYKFQELCNQYNVKPIYLTNYEASMNTIFQDFTREYEDKLEIGLHLHAWNSPPCCSLTKDDFFYQPYLHEYPHDAIRNKIDYMVKNLQDIFQTDIISHRGGRYSVSEPIFESLLENGIKVDCSVVPGMDWSGSKGDPNSNGGPDFRGYNRNIYKIHKELLEIPVSTYTINDLLNNLSEYNILRRVVAKAFGYKNLTLRSKIDNLKELKKVVEWNMINKCTHLDYIIHSSELVKGTSSLIKTGQEENLFYQNLENFFIYMSKLDILPMTFKEYIG